MLITVKNLQQQTFTVEFEAEKTVLELKQKIFIERGPEYVVEKQKLIYAGVILDDERTISSYNIDEKKFVVVMIKRDLFGLASKPDDVGSASTSTCSDAGNMSSGEGKSSAPSADTQINQEAGDDNKTHDMKTCASGTKVGGTDSDEDTKSVGSGGSDNGSGGGTALGPVGSNTSILSTGSGGSLLSGGSGCSESSETSHSTYSSGDLAGVFSNTSLQSHAESNLLMGEEYNKSVDAMIEMGYCRELVERAMDASFNNPERAVEYLISGIPETDDDLNSSMVAGNVIPAGSENEGGGGDVDTGSNTANRGVGDGGDGFINILGPRNISGSGPGVVGDGRTRIGDSTARVGDGLRIGDGSVHVGEDPPGIGDGTTRVGDGPPRIGDGPARIGDDPARVGDGPPPIGDGPRIGDGPARVAEDSPRIGGGPTRIGEGSTRIGDGPTRIGDGPPRIGDGVPRIGDGPTRIADCIPRIGDDPSCIGDGPPRIGSGSVNAGSTISGDGTTDASRRPGADGRIGPGIDPFEFLRNQPQFVQMRSLVYRNPDLLQAVLQQIGQTNPALLQLISENQDAFLSMLNQPSPGQTSPVYPRRMTPGRRAQLAAAQRAAAGGDGLHVRALDTAPGADGDGPPVRRRPDESGDAGADTIPHDMLPPRPDRAAERRAAAADAFMRERAAAAAAVAALTAAASAAVDRDSGAGEGGGVSSGVGIGGGSITGTGTAISAGDTASPTENITEDNGGITTIRLTPQERDAIERLKAMGFPETLVLQAYFACDKDEHLAANFLISSSFDD